MTTNTAEERADMAWAFSQVCFGDIDHGKDEDFYPAKGVHPRGGGVFYRYQCQACGWPGRFTSEDGWDGSTEWDADKAAAVRVRFNDALNQWHTDKKVRELSVWRAEHAAYLKTAKWRHLRGLVMRRCGSRCEGCGDRAASQVHHVTYKHWKDELLWELVGVCDDCHDRAHAKEAA